MTNERGPVSPHAHAEVDLAAVAHNTALFAERTKASVIAVVKADGFGHGAAAVARTALDSGADWLATATTAESLRLRADGITAPTLSWLLGPVEDFRDPISAGIDLSASSEEQLARIAADASLAGLTAAVHLKVDTGLHRAGALLPDWPELVRRARDLELGGSIRIRGIWSHLRSGTDATPPSVGSPVAIFEEALVAARRAGLRPEVRHLANSVAALAAPETHYELVRPGIGLYGVEPDPRQAFGLRGAMTLRTRLALTKRVPAGSGVSYEHDYVTDRESNLGLVPLGYADGIPFTATGRAEVWVAGRRHPVAGRIAMNQFVVDLGEHIAEPGDEVIIFGPGERGEPTVTDWARWARTVPHEILIGVGSRISRYYVGAPAAREDGPCHV